MPQLPPVTGVTARFQGPGLPGFTTTWYYWVQAIYPNGNSLLSASANTGPYAPSQLSSYAFNAVQWNSAPGAVGYYLYANTTGTTPDSTGQAIFIATSETGFKDDGSLPAFAKTPKYDGVYMWRAVYNFAVDGGAIGLIIPSISDPIPNHAIVFGAMLNFPVGLVGAGASVSIGTNAGSSAVSLIAVNVVANFSATDGLAELLGINSQGVTNKRMFKMTAAGQIALTVSGAVLTAGLMEIFALGVIPSNA